MFLSHQIRALAFAAACTFSATLTTAPAEIVISEFLAENDGGLEDADGDQPDWIELHNNGASPVDLAGWHLTDDPQEPMRWALPSFVLNAGERRVIFASGKDRRDPLGELHTDFALQNSGGYLALRRPDGIKPSEWNPYPAQRADISYGAGTLSDGEDLVTATTGGKFHVPASGALGTTWTAAGFDDASWTVGATRLGYQVSGAPSGLPIAYWTFDDSTSSAVPGGPGISVFSTSYDASVPGAISDGKSLHFTRSGNTYATASLDVSETAYTCSFWFRTSSPTTGLFSVHSGNLGANGNDRNLYLTGGNIGVRTYNSPALVSTSLNYADNQWHHVAHVYGASIGGQRVYVDGVLVLSGTKAQSDFTWQDHVTIGFSNDPAAEFRYHDGEIDDLAIWSDALNPAAIQSLAAGTNPIEVSGFGPYINTNVETPMRNVSASLYARFPFTINRQTPLNSATLRVRYDDGFVAYLDGVEIARRNAPAEAAFDSLAASDRSAIDAKLLETIDISAHTNLLTNGSHVLAVHALNDSAASGDFLLNVELSAATLSQQSGIYMDPPTPGQPNNPGFGGFVADTSFLPKRGFYDTAQNVVISSATPGATIAYTTDGTDPSSSNGTQVPVADAMTPPSVTINVASTKAIRAIAYKGGTGLRPTNIDSHTYIFPNQVLVQPNNPAGFNPQWKGRAADYGMDAGIVNTTLAGYSARAGLLSLPTLSMTGRTADLFDAPSGIYYDTALRGTLGEKKVSIEWINPDGTPGWHAQAGARIHGNSSRGHSFTPKHPMRLIFREEYGTSKLNEDVFEDGGVEKFDQLLLRGCSTDSFPVVDGNFSDGEQRWNNDKGTYLRDQYLRDALNDLGSPNARGRYCHLYINGLYWGLYNISERPTASFFAETFGGEKDDWDVIKDFQELHDGSAAAWNAMIAINNDSVLTHEERAQKIIGNNPDGSRNPAYEVLLHLPSFIDYMIVHIAAGAEDWPDHDFWAGRRRGTASDGFHFVAWDQEISNDSLTRKSGRGSGNPFELVGDPSFQSPVDRNGPAGLYDTFRRVPVFQKMFKERIHALLFNQGPLTPAANKARWALRQAQIDKAIVAESARWGDAAERPAKKRETTWLQNMAYMNTPVTGYWDAIQPIAVQRFRNAGIYPSIDPVVFSQNGGVVPNGFELYFLSEQPVVLYTLDGSDPMGPDGLQSPNAYSYAGGFSVADAIPQFSEWRYLVTGSAPAANWKQSSFDDSAWSQGDGQLGYGDGDEVTVIGDGGNENSRNITTYFRKTFALTKAPQSATLHLLRDDGAVVYLNGKEVVRSNMHPTNAIGYATTASTTAVGEDEVSFYYQYKLSASDFVVGQNVLAVEVHKVSGTDDDLSFDARLEVTSNAAPSPLTLTQSGTVKVRAQSPLGEWSELNSAYFVVDAAAAGAQNIVVSELHYNPAAPTLPEEIAVSPDADDYEFIELLNIGSVSVDLTGVEFTAGFDFHFPTGFTLAPGERCVVVKNADAFAVRYGAEVNVAGAFENGTGLSNGGEAIALALVAPGSTTPIKSFSYDDVAPWPVAADGTGPSLVLLNPTANPDHNLAANWVASAGTGGNPSASPAGMTFSQWSAGYEGAFAPDGDNDGDGFSNALEFALALDPLQQDSSVLKAAPRVAEDGRAYLELTFRRRLSDNGISIQIESSENLTIWSAEPYVSLTGRTSHGDGTATETWRCSTPMDARTKQFLRLRATIEP